jgi:DNA-binding XRE family transcriptional regulator
MLYLRTARLDRKMTQQGLADHVGLKRSSLANLELGWKKGSLTTWDKLEKALGVDQKVLRRIDGEPS